MGGVVLHYRRRNNNVGRRRGSGHERAILAPAGLYARHGVRGVARERVAPTMSPMEEARRRAGLDGTNWGGRRGEGARRGGGLVESAGAASVVHVKGRV